MQRRNFLATASSALFAAQKRAPNLVLVLFDDLGWRDFSSYGNPFHQTPHIDALAREGTRFTNAYAACPVCSPTRSAVLSGKYPIRTGVTDWIPGRAQWKSAKLITPRTALQMRLEEQTLAERLRPAGYATASIGKWHLGGTGFSPTDQGFDLNIGGNHKGSNPYFGPFDLPGLAGRTKEQYLTDELHSAVRSWVGQQTSARKPFFLYCPNYSVHTPIQAPESQIQAVQGKSKREQTYRAMLEITDAHIGRLREQLRAAGEYENTIWAITSDNGGLRFEGKDPVPFTDNAPLRAGKGHLYEGGIRVPLILAGPGVAKAKTDSSLASSIDLMPTLLDLAGQRPPAGIDGVSLRKVPARRALFWHYPHYSNQGGVPGGAMRERDAQGTEWKLIEFYEDRRLELFNLSADPGEKVNLIAQEAKRANSMQRALQRWRAAGGAIMPTENPNFEAASANQGLAGAEDPTEPARMP